MKKELSLLVILFSFSFALKAQSLDTAFFDPLSYRNHIGFNTQIITDHIFDPEVRTPFELMYKRQLKDMRAWRVQLKGRYNRRFEQYDTRAAYQIKETTTTSQVGVSIGFEWQYILSKRWFWYWGADIGYNLDQVIKNVENDEGVIYTDKMTGKEYFLYTTRKIPTHTLSGAPFIGFRFHVNKRLYVSAEMNMLLHYALQKNQFSTINKFLDGSERDGGTSGFAKFRDHKMEFRPYSGFYIFFLL